MKSWLLLVTLALTVAVAIAGGPDPEPPCAVLVEFTLHGYDGIHIDQACLSAPAVYSNGLLTVEAVQDGIFRAGFEQWP